MSEALISLQEIRKTYVLGEQTVHALKKIDLDIYRGEYVALMGPSGSGKSTLMNIIGCLDTPSSGKYWLNHKEVSQMSDIELSKVRSELSPYSLNREKRFPTKNFLLYISNFNKNFWK